MGFKSVQKEFTANVEVPLRVNDGTEFAWDDEADVVVVGFGGAGVVASLQALEDGASVIAIDRFAAAATHRRAGGRFR